MLPTMYRTKPPLKKGKLPTTESVYGFRGTKREQAELDREKKVQQAALAIRENTVKRALKGMNLLEGATTREEQADWRSWHDVL